MPLYDLKGQKKKDMKFPFSFEYRPDLIKRSVLSSQSKRRQSYGPDKRAGKKTSAHYHGSRHAAPDSVMMGREMSRMPRIHGDGPAHLRLRGVFAPHAVGGRKAHPPKPEKDFVKNINKKEKKLALLSAISNTANPDAVRERNHKFNEVPVIVENGIESLEKTKDLKKSLENLGLKEDLDRVKKKKIRAGKGKRRGRKYKKKTGPLIVVGEDKGVVNASKSLPGVEAYEYDKINSELLSPGAHGIRLTIWSDSAVKKLEKRYKSWIHGK